MPKRMRLFFAVAVASLVWNSGAFAASAPSAKPPAVGDKAPGFTLENQDGRSVSLSESRGHPVVLVFYRGYW